MRVLTICVFKVSFLLRNQSIKSIETRLLSDASFAQHFFFGKDAKVRCSNVENLIFVVAGEALSVEENFSLAGSYEAIVGITCCSTCARTSPAVQAGAGDGTYKDAVGCGRWRRHVAPSSCAAAEVVLAAAAPLVSAVSAAATSTICTASASACFCAASITVSAMALRSLLRFP